MQEKRIHQMGKQKQAHTPTSTYFDFSPFRHMSVKE